ncbi:hypothetical protein Y590_17675 [Methylobacterium sp. AMS5]|nr:hypothetical protein Y590_17675 [Methylobacterium sp. AMS5]
MTRITGVCPSFDQAAQMTSAWSSPPEGAGPPLLIVLADEGFHLQHPIHPVHLTLHKVEDSLDPPN